MYKMAENWKPGGSIIEQDGEKILQLRGVKLVDKRPVKVVVHYSLADIQRFIESFVNRVIKDRDDKVLSLYPDARSMKDDIVIKGIVDETIDLLKKREDQPNADYYARLSVYVIVGFAFDIPIWQSCDDKVYMPSTVKEMMPTTLTSSSILLPDDILRKEISTRMTSPRSLSVMRMASKSLQTRKYKYEHLVTIIPRQAFLVLTTMYEVEKDLEYKGYLFNLIMKTYSSLNDIDRSLMDTEAISNSMDVLVAIVALKIQAPTYMGGAYSLISEFENTDLLEMLVERGIITMDDVKFHTLSFSRNNSLSDSFIPFIERWERERKIPSGVLLYEDLKSGKITHSYKWRLIVDAIKKGYIKEPSSIKKEVVSFPFLEGIWDCSQEEKDLLHKYFEPNPLSDFYLAGIKPTLQSVVELVRQSDDYLHISDYIMHGLTFSDDVIDYHNLFVFTDEMGDNVDLRFLPGDHRILFLKDLGEGKHLVLAGDFYSNYRVFTIKNIGEFFIEDTTLPKIPLFIEYIANTTDELLQRVIDYAKEYSEILEMYDVTDKNVTDLELYRKFAVNMNTIVKIATGENLW